MGFGSKPPSPPEAYSYYPDYTRATAEMQMEAPSKMTKSTPFNLSATAKTQLKSTMPTLYQVLFDEKGKPKVFYQEDGPTYQITKKKTKTGPRLIQQAIPLSNKDGYIQAWRFGKPGKYEVVAASAVSDVL